MRSDSNLKPNRSRKNERTKRPCKRLTFQILEDRSVPSAGVGNFGSIPLSFEANHGQADADVRFWARGPGYGLSLTGTEAVLMLNRTSAAQDDSQDTAPVEIRMQVFGANRAANVSGQDQLPGVVNYFIGDDSSKWRANIRTFGRVAYDAVYPGIDLVYYGNQRQLEYDFVVTPGSDPSSIRLEFDGAEQLTLDAQGNLVLHTGSGDVIQNAPVLYQQVGPDRIPVAGAFRLDGNQVTFQVGAYDASLPLVIDPVLSYSTYLGGSGYDAGTAIAVDSAGNTYITGQTGTANFPTTAGAFRTTLGGTYNAAFVTKLNPAGTGLVYSTYLGGGALTQTVGYGIAVDAAGNAYVTGETSSPDFPTTPGAFQSPTPMGYDAFVTKLNSQGSGLLYSVRLGGLFDDFARGIAVDANGQAVVTGWLTNDNLPPLGPGFPTANAFQPEYGGGFADAFVTKCSADGSTLIFSTYLGGASFASDWGQAVATDSEGNTYVTGHTYALNFPTTAGAFTRPGAAGLNAFVTKFASDGSVVYSTHAIGGSGHEEAYGIAVDAAGNAYITGNTDSWDDPTNSIDTGFPTTVGAYRRTLVGQIDAFVAKLNAAGSDLVYGTYLGGNSDPGPGGYGVDRGWGIAVDATGSAYVTGDTDSVNFPVVNGIQTFHYWYKDVFVTKLNPAGTGLVYSTYLGGNLVDEGRGIALDAAGNAYVTGSTDSYEFPTTTGAFQPANAGGIDHHDDAFIARIGSALPAPPRVSSNGVVINNGSAQRSRVTQVRVDFNQVVTLPSNPATAFQLQRQSDSGLVGLTASVVNDTATHVTFSFTGSLSEFGSLSDGRYTLRIFASQVSNANGKLDGNGDGVGGDDYQLVGTPANGLFRFFGDVDGNGIVDGVDFGAFRTAFNTNSAIFDFDGNGVVDGLDFGQFRQRFGMVI